MRGAQREAFHEMSLETAAHGWLCCGISNPNVESEDATYRHSSTTTVSLFAGMNPSMKTFLLPQL